MKKKVFKGTINGVEYDNLTNYSRDLQKLSEEGVDINETSAEYVTTNYDDEIEESTKNITKEDNIDIRSLKLFPFFEEGDDYYLDVDEMTSDDATKVFIDFFKKLPDKLNKLNYKQLKAYKDTTKDIYNCILSDQEFADDKIAKYNKEILSLNKKLSDMNNYKAKINVFKNSYNRLVKDLGNILTNNSKVCDCDDQCECQGKCKNCNDQCNCKKEHDTNFRTRHEPVEVDDYFNNLFNTLFDYDDICNKFFK